jgi:hypothetical protein
VLDSETREEKTSKPRCSIRARSVLYVRTRARNVARLSGSISPISGAPYS